MPRKQKAWSTKEIQKAAKEQELVSITNWVHFFNQDPVEYLRESKSLKPFRENESFKDEFAKIEHDPQAQETLRQSFKQVAEAIKAVIVAYEDFWQGRAPEDGLERLRGAVEALNELLKFKVTYKLGVSNAGVISYDPRLSKFKLKIDLFSQILSRQVVSHVVNFEEWLSRYQDLLPIGVCRYEKCRKFFVKKRRDERYCSPRHANTAAVRRKRERERRKRRKNPL